MDIKVGLSIYNKPWLIEPEAGLQLLDFFELIKLGQATWNNRRVKAFDDDREDEMPDANEILQKFFAREGVVFCPTNTYDLRNFKGFEGSKVAVIPVFGPMMKSDFCGDFGTATLRNMARVAAQTKSVETVVTHWDTPGGTVDGTKPFADQIVSIARDHGKNTISFIDSLCCSAGYWGASSSQTVIASNTTDIIGSIGTMCSWYDNTEEMRARGRVKREYYATRSKDKNRAFREAEQGKDNGKLLIEEMLDPLNNEFLRDVAANRNGKINIEKHDVFTGKTYLSQTAQEHGLIDGIASFEEVIGEALNKTKPYKRKSMSGTNLAFGNTLAAAKANEFKVVDGGFLLTEENLNAIEGKLEQNETVIATTTQALKEAKANAVDGEALKTTQAELDAANAKIKTLEASVEASGQKIAKLEADAKEYEKGAESFFGKKGTNAQDPKGAHEQDDQAEIDNMPHNKKADEII